ncbi:hypothetical protein M3Y94_01233900 [Aphelenchoides besseyi]|nr:hypothetical protein M3Y94_01233900 [Aphelenchoides besseyi]
MTTVNQESAIVQLMRMVGPDPQALTQTNGTASIPKSTSIARPQASRLPISSTTAIPQQVSGQKRKATAPLQMNPPPTTPDPRILFPAAMSGMPSMMPGFPMNGIHPAAIAPKTTTGIPMMNPHFLPPQLAAQMMMINPMVSSAFPTQQLTPELMALVANVAAYGGNPMDAINLMQNPTMLAKMYADYAAYIQLHQQQQQFQTMLAQQQAQTMLPPPKKRSTPTVRTPTTTDKSLADPLTSLQNMVNPRNVSQTSSPAVKPEAMMPIVIEDDVKDEVVIVDDEIKSNEANVVPPNGNRWIGFFHR